MQSRNSMQSTNTMQHNFSLQDLTRLLGNALKTWSGDRARFECIRIRCDSDGRTHGCAFIRAGLAVSGTRSRTVNLSHELICLGIYQASKAEALPLTPGSLVFSLGGYVAGGAANPTARAQAASGEETEPEETHDFPAGFSHTKYKGEIIQFPAAVSVFFDHEELQALLKAAAQRSEYVATSVTINYDEQVGTSAELSIKTGTSASAGTSTIKLDPEQLKQKLTEELSEQGYQIDRCQSAFRFSGTPSSCNSPNCVSLEVFVLALPNQ